MNTKPKIFNVMQWVRSNNAGEVSYTLECHHVAGFTSRDAEEAFKASIGQGLSGKFFICTDEWLEYIPESAQAVRNYVTRMTNAESHPQWQFDNWLKRTTIRSNCDGEILHAAFRRFHIENNRKAKA